MLSGKPELGFGYLKVGAEGHTTITTRSRTRAAGEPTVEVYADMQINNTGTENAEGLKIKVEYSKIEEKAGVEETVWYPVDTEGEALIAGPEWKLDKATSLFSLFRRSAGSDGIFTLKDQDGTCGQHPERKIRDQRDRNHEALGFLLR